MSSQKSEVDQALLNRMSLIAESRMDGILAALVGAEDLAQQANRAYPGLVPLDIIARMRNLYSEIDQIKRRGA
jgi:hypothetical protein